MNIRNENYLSNRLHNIQTSESAEGGLDINEFVSILRRNTKTIFGFTFGFTLLALLKIITSPPSYVSGFELLSESVNIETKVTATNENSRKTREEITDVNLDEIQLKILQSPKLLLQALKDIQNKYPELNYSELKAGLTIDIISNKNEDQNVLQVIYTSSDKEEVEDVTDVLSKVYQNYSVEKRQSGVNRGIAFLDRQIPEIYNQSQEIQSRIAELRTAYNFNNPKSSLQQITGRINDLERRKEENDLKLKEHQLALDNLNRELATKLTIAETSYDTSRYTALLNQLKEIDLEIGQKSTVFSERSEILQALRKEREQLMTQIAEAKIDVRLKIVNRINTIENLQQNLSSQIEELKIRLRQWSKISGEFDSLQNQLNIANSKLNEFNSQKDALQIDAAQQESPWQILTPAGEAITNEINSVNFLLLGSTLGLLTGVGATFFMDKQKDIIYSSAKIEQITNLPVLAAIPYSPKSRKISLLKSTTFVKESGQLSTRGDNKRERLKSTISFLTPSVESFRSFAANLELLNFKNDSEISNLNRDNDLKAISITSAIPQEGKSTVAMNLAKAVASVGKKVLIVDSDLRSNKNLTNSLGFETSLGLRNILQQQISSSPTSYIQRLPTEENLFLLSSGINTVAESSLEEDPGRLLASTKMHSLMEDLEKTFDLVIYDLCSIIGFADVNLLAKKTDGTILVTGLGKIQSVAFKEALNQLQACNITVLGVALNKLINKN